jgi:hypothetical protein
MDPNYLYYFHFFPKDEYQKSLLEDFRRLRAIFGIPHKIAYIRAVVRTRRYTRSVYPPGWKFR